MGARTIKWFQGIEIGDWRNDLEIKLKDSYTTCTINLKDNKDTHI